MAINPKSLENLKPFEKGHSFAKGRVKGSRNRITQELLDLIANGRSPAEALYEMQENEELPPELRYKAAAKLTDIVYPKASSVEVIVDEKDKWTKEQLEERILVLANKVASVEDTDADTDEEDSTEE